MGGKSSVINPVGNNFLGGGVVGRGLGAVATGGISEFTKKNPFGAPINNPLARAFGNGDTTNPYVSGPFSLDPNQFAADRGAINDLGQKQYDDTLSAIDKNSAAQQDYAAQTLKRMTPDIEEGLNAQHLLNSSALPQELARQASNLSQDVASQRANAIQQALTGKQGFETGALQRGLSLEDFINQANVSKSIGAQMAPQAPSGKAQAGSVMQGVGALAPWASVASSGKAGKSYPNTGAQNYPGATLLPPSLRL